jgi:protein TonB
MMAVRSRLLAVGAGSAAAFGLLFLMQALIASGEQALTETVERRVVDFVRVEREETLERRQSKPQRPSKPEAAPPDAPQPSLNQSADVGGQAIGGVGGGPVDVGRLDFDLGTGFGVGAGTADGDYMPLVKVQPVYPRRAQTRGIEGWVIVELTVTETGGVTNPYVVSSEPSGIFDKAALEAALKFKYKPRVVNGKAIEVRGVRYRMTFVLEE